MSTTAKISDARSRLLNVRFDLQRLANAFSETGNHHVAACLEEIAKEVASASETVEEAWSEELSGSLRQAQANAAGILSALLDNCSEAKP